MAVSKEHIIGEIKRTAVLNDGAPLGRLKFEKETGVRESDWNIHWVRWNDAVIEAGLKPNQKTVAYDVDFLNEKLVEFIREIGRFPVSNEFRMKARKDDGFPSEKTFMRLGSKPQKALRIIEYCQNRNGYEDVIQICEAVIPDEPSQQLDESISGTEEIGFVYMLKAGRFYKVGLSKSFERRERELAIQLPQKAETVHVIRTDDPAGIEAYWHNRFKEQRQNGEWFELSGKDVKAFKRRKFM